MWCHAILIVNIGQHFCQYQGGLTHFGRDSTRIDVFKQRTEGVGERNREREHIPSGMHRRAQHIQGARGVCQRKFPRGGRGLQECTAGMSGLESQAGAGSWQTLQAPFITDSPGLSPFIPVQLEGLPPSFFPNIHSLDHLQFSAMCISPLLPPGGKILILSPWNPSLQNMEEIGLNVC